MGLLSYIFLFLCICSPPFIYSWRSSWPTSILQMIHSVYGMGPASIFSYNEHQYFVPFIDDFFRFILGKYSLVLSKLQTYAGLLWRKRGSRERTVLS